MNRKQYGELVGYIYEYCNRTLVKPNDVSAFMEKLKLDVLIRYFETAPDTYVLKRDGSIEKFDREKLYISIGSASDSIDEPLTSSDIHNIVTKALTSLEQGKINIIPTDHVRNEALKAMKELGFDEVYNKYESNYG